MKGLFEQLIEDNRELIDALDQEARLYSGILLEKAARSLDLAYRDELQGLEAALERAEKRIAQLEERLARLEQPPAD